MTESHIRLWSRSFSGMLALMCSAGMLWVYSGAALAQPSAQPISPSDLEHASSLQTPSGKADASYKPNQHAPSGIQSPASEPTSADTAAIGIHTPPATQPVSTAGETSPLSSPSTISSQASAQSASQAELLAPVTLKASLVKVQAYPVDLPTILELVEDQNLSVELAKMDTSLQRAYLYGSMASLLPDVTAGLVYSHSDGAIQIFGSQTIPAKITRFNPSVGLQWLVYPGGRHLFEILSAKRRLKAVQHQGRQVTQQELAEGAIGYYNLVEALLKRQIAKDGISVAEGQLNLNEARQSAGVGTKLEVMQSITEVARQEGNLIRAEGSIVQAEQTLLNQLNLDPELHLTPMVIDAIARPLVPEEASVRQLITTGLKRHPGFARLQQELKAIRSDRSAVASDVIPSVTLRATISGVGTRPDNLTRNTFYGLEAQANVLDNLGFSIPLQVLEKNRQIKRKQLEIQSLTRDIEAQVIQGLLDVETAQKGIEVAQRGVEATNEAFRLANGRYRAGVGIFLDVVEAQKNVTEARTEYTQAVMNYNRAHVRLLQAMGLVTRETLVTGIHTDQLAHDDK